MRRLKATLAGIGVLLADDNPELLAVIETVIADAGGTVRSASTGRLALTVLETFTPDVVVLDICMPGMDGYGLVSVIRQMPAFRTIPAIAISGLARRSDTACALQCGFNVHLSKPFDCNALVELIGSLAGSAALPSVSTPGTGVSIVGPRFTG
jgi:CheY-like chemotaxis protein